VESLKVLIIEDEKRLANAIVHILQGKKFLVDKVYDGQSGVDYALGMQYDVIILDIMLPKLDGFSVVKELREHKNSTPILMLTARDTVPDKVLGLNAGADDYMTKPFEPDELVARINALARRQSELVMNEIAFDDLTLDLISGDLKCGDESVHLSYKEFEVMQIFLSNPKITVTKESLIVNVWGMDSDAEDNNVEAYISFLRKKLKFLNSRVTIKNLQKIGYRLEVMPC